MDKNWDNIPPTWAAAGFWSSDSARSCESISDGFTGLGIETTALWWEKKK